MDTTQNYSIPMIIDGSGQQIDQINNNLSMIDTGLGGYLTKSVAGSSNVTLTVAEWRNAMFEFTGLLTGNIAVIVPITTRFFFVFNNTTGSFTLTVRTSGGSGVAVPQGSGLILRNNGVDVFASSVLFTASSAPANQFANGISSGGNLTYRRPVVADLTDGSTGTGAVVLTVAPTIEQPLLLGPVALDASSGAVGLNIIGRNNSGVDEGFLQFFKNNGTTLEGFIYGHSNILTIGDAAGVDIINIKAGQVGIATAAPTSNFDVNDNRIRIRTAFTPASASAAGNQGDICWDSSYVYICISTNTWRRIAHSTW